MSRRAAAIIVAVALAVHSGGSIALGSASSAFWTAWGDGKAELSGYAVTTKRYGELRDGRLVLIYVTEPMDRRVWIKDDSGDVPPAERVNVLKLNSVLTFQTGIYPYTVMTSVFAPVDPGSGERFSPAKITLSAQEWCGHVYHKVMPGAASFASESRSYFHSEGDSTKDVKVPPGTIYEDALLVQMRELDGPFTAGKDWSGSIVPSLWSARKRHAPVAPLAATIKRENATRDGAAVTRFTVAYGTVVTTYDVEKSAPRRVLGWKTNDGEVGRILKTTRLPYWKLNHPGDEKHLKELGF